MTDRIHFPVPPHEPPIARISVDLPEERTARRLLETNQLLAQMVDVAQEDAANARLEAKTADTRTFWALVAAWVAVAVTVVVGAVQIWVAFAFPH
jgi:hypothetical protein